MSKMNLARIIYFISFLITPLFVFSQASDWNESTLEKQGKVIIPANIDLQLPAGDDYKIGFFVYDSVNNIFRNVGQANYVLGQPTIIWLAYDPEGVNGYKKNERMISLVKGINTSNVYGVEFINYYNGNRFIYGGTVVADGVASSTWKDLVSNTLRVCKFQKRYVIPVPYGLRPGLLYSSGIAVDSSGAYPVLLLDSMEAGESYSFQVMDKFITYKRYLYGMIFYDFPVEVLNKTYSICPGEKIPISEYNADSTLKWYPFGSHTYNLSIPGRYPYTLMYYPNGCNTIDTITVQIDPKFQADEFFKTYSICLDDTVYIPELSDKGVVRSTSQYGTRNLYADGIYYFPARDKVSQCILMDTITIKIKPFPVEVLNKTYSICPGEVIDLSSDIEFERTPLMGSSEKLIVKGTYLFSTKDLKSNCTRKDTVHVVNKSDCKGISYPGVVDPITGNGIVFAEPEKVTIYDSALVKIVQLIAPVIWNGTDSSGAVLPVGIYYVVHEDGSSHSVSLIY